MAKDPICGMLVDDKTGLRLTHKGDTFLFCSTGCLEKFAKENNVSKEQIAACTSESKKRLYKNKTLIVAAVLILLALLSYVIHFLEPFRLSLWMYFKTLWWAILLGLFLGGIIDHYVPRKYVSHILSSPRKP